jgi:MFS family permease
MARDLRLFYLFRLLSTSYLFVPISVAFALSRGLGLVEVMALNSIYCVIVILTEVPTGALADRHGRRPAMMAGAVAMVAACVVYALAHSFAAFAVAETLAELSMTLCSGADSAYLFDLLNDHGRGDEYALREGTASAWHQGGQTLAFAAGGLLGARHLVLPYLVTIGVATLAFFVALGMREDRPGAVASRPLSPREYLREMRASLHIVAKRRSLLWLIGYSTVVFVLLRATIYIYQPYLAAAGYGVAEIGLIFAGVYLAATFVAHHTKWLRRRFGDATLLWGLLAVLAVTFLVLGGIPMGPSCLGLLVIQAGANGLYSPLVKPFLNREIDDSRRRATLLSVESMARRSAFGLFSPGVGALMAAHGATAGLTACGLLGVAGLLVLAVTAKAAPATAALPAKTRAASEPGVGASSVRE